MNSKFKYKGFTLIELLLVVTILGILAAMAIPKLFPQSEKARVAEAINILSAIRQNEEAYFLAHGEYLECYKITTTTCWESLGMGNPNNDARLFTYKVFSDSSDTFTATATRKNVPVGITYSGNKITIDNAGKWCDSHPLKPSNPDGTIC